MLKHVSISLFITGLLSSVSFAATYEIDAGHSSVNFKVRHLVAKTKGEFKKFKGTFEFEKGKSESWVVNAQIETGSIDTNNKKRDEHLRSKDFFDVAKYPTITFKSTKVSDVRSNEAKVTGELTMHGVTKTVDLELELTGEGKDPWGNDRAGFTAKTKLNRKDFGIEYNKTLETGGLLLGDDVEVVLEIEGLKKAQVASTGSSQEKKAKK